MLEARESLNVRFTLDGFDCQYTVRTDQEHELLLNTFKERLALLADLGAAPTGRQPSNSNPGGRPPPDINGKPAPAEAPDCRTCGDSSHMELLTWNANGQQRSAWKCQHCGTWHYPNDKAKGKKGVSK